MGNTRRKEEYSDSIISRYLAGELDQTEIESLEDLCNSDDKIRDELFKLEEIWSTIGKLKEMELINIEKARRKIEKRLQGFRRGKGFFYYLQKVAALLFIPLLLSGFLYIHISQTRMKQQVVINETNIAFGTTSKLTLADGTKVWLNSGSYLKYPQIFKGKTRKVYLEGEAYFEVTKNKNKPFIVQTSQYSVMATGTSFNILAYPNEDAIETTLISGKVAFINEMPDEKYKILTNLKPGETGVFLKNERKIIMKAADIDKVISWKYGELIFVNDPMSEVVRKLSRWYNTDIVLVDKQLLSYSYTATFTDESLPQILELLKLSSPIEYYYTGRKKNADNTFSKRRVEIRMKK